MKPAPFEYHAARTRQEALELLDQYGDDAKILAGGQSLGPLLNLRLSSPRVLIDINKIPDLAYERDNGRLVFGAMIRQRAMEESESVRRGWPLLFEAIPHIGHRTIRNRGTIGGSLAHADPAAELPAVALVLEAEMVLQKAEGTRTVSARDFFSSYFTTAIGPGELLTEVSFTRLPEGTGTCWVEFAPRRGDYALVGVAAAVTLDQGGRCVSARLGYSNVMDVPWRPDGIASLLVGSSPTEEGFREVAEAAAREASPSSGLLASASYRRHLIRMLTRQALGSAAKRAAEDGSWIRS